MATVHSEFFWSRNSAERAGERLKARHGFGYNVTHALRADGGRDWLLTVVDDVLPGHCPNCGRHVAGNRDPSYARLVQHFCEPETAVTA